MDDTVIHIHGFSKDRDTNVDICMTDYGYYIEGRIMGQPIFQKYPLFVDAIDDYRELYRKYWENEEYWDE